MRKIFLIAQKIFVRNYTNLDLMVTLFLILENISFMSQIFLFVKKRISLGILS